MSLPHHGYWDRVAAYVTDVPTGFDATLPLIGRLGRRVRRQKRGYGRALGRSARGLHQLGTLDIFSKRFRVVIRRHKWRMLGTLVGFLAIMGVVVVAVKVLADHGSGIVFGAVILLSIVGGVIGTIRRDDVEAWPLLAVCRRRCALLKTSRRYRGLHIEAGENQSPEQLARFIRERREHWATRLKEIPYRRRTAFAYREFWWLSIPSLLYVGVMMLSTQARVAPLNFVSAIVLFQVFIYLVPALLAKRRLSRLRRSLTEFSCPDCGYPLADFAAGRWRGAQVPGLGPPRCVECGSPWPLLPPPRSRIK
jgi:hypothetical protein